MFVLLARLAAASCTLNQTGDPIRLDLVSVAPGADLFSSMGHTALVFSGGDLEEPVALDWGAYDADRASMAEFLRGDLPFFLRRQPAFVLLDALRESGRTVVVQQLDVPTARIAPVQDALTREVLAGGAYRYHWGQNNCATKARDVIDGLLAGGLRDDTPSGVTARQEATRHLAPWPVLSFAWRFIASSTLDHDLSRWERTMLPEELMLQVPAVSTCTVPGALGWAPRSAPLPPWAVPGLLGSAAVVLWRRRRWVGWLLVLYGTVLALLGTLSFVLASVSSLDGVGPTENWLVAGPQSWALVWVGLRMLRGRAVPWAVPLVIGVLGLGALALKLQPFSQANHDILWALLPGLLTCCAVAMERTRRPERSTNPAA